MCFCLSVCVWVCCLLLCCLFFRFYFNGLMMGEYLSIIEESSCIVFIQMLGYNYRFEHHIAWLKRIQPRPICALYSLVEDAFVYLFFLSSLFIEIHYSLTFIKSQEKYIVYVDFKVMLLNFHFFFSNFIWYLYFMAFVCMHYWKLQFNALFFIVYSSPLALFPFHIWHCYYYFFVIILDYYIHIHVYI